MSEVVMCSKCKTWVQPGAKTCPKCGAPIVTQEMAERQMDAEDEAKLQKKRNIALFISIILCIVITIAFCSSAREMGTDMTTGIFMGGLVLGFMLGGAPCGWVATGVMREKIHPALLIPLIGWFFWIWAAVCMAMFAGWVFFPVYLVKFILNIVKKKQA